MKKRILVMPDGNWLAHTSRPLEIAKVLREKGYEVVFAGEGRFMRLPEEAGFPVYPVKTIDPEYVMHLARKGRVNWYYYELIDELINEELKLFEDIKPDLVLSDFRLTLSTSCELAEIPLAVTLNASWTNYYALIDKAPEHLGITKILGKKLTNLLMPWAKDIMVSHDSKAFKKYREQKGLKPNTNIWDVWAGDLNLITDIPEYGPTRDLPANYHYIGPITWEADIEPPKWLRDIDPATPTLYITMGSTGYAKFFEVVKEIFGDRDCQCIVTTGGLTDTGEFPDNFFVTNYAPGDLLLEKSDLVICHGGNGTIYQALYEGVPVIGIPTMHDQEFNLQRVEDLGVGIQLSELNFKPQHLKEAVEKVLLDPSFKMNAMKYKDILKDYDGPSRGAELIDKYLFEIEFKRLAKKFKDRVEDRVYAYETTLGCA